MMPRLQRPRRPARRAWLCGTGVVAMLVLAGCATPAAPLHMGAERTEWNGRLGLTVGSEPPQAFQAAFELRGNPTRGELVLSTPLGTRLASVRWQPEGAELRQGNDLSRHESVEALTAQISGAPLPVTALFDWLQGRQADVAGWQADLARQPEGRISAQRTHPAPEATLRIVLDP